MRELLERFRRLSPGWQRLIVTALFMLAQVIIWVLLFETGWYKYRSITDTPVYYDYAGRIARHMLPYRDFTVEYPPVAVLLFSLPRIVSGSSYDHFVTWFQLEMLAFSCGIVAILSSLAWRQWRSIGKVAGTLGAYTFFLLAMGSIVECRFDLAAAFIILASIACFVTDRYLFAWILLGVGMMTKIVPLLLAPVFLIVHFRRRQFSELWLGPLALGITALIIAIPFLFGGAFGLALSFIYHADRPVQIESIWASPIMLRAVFDHSYIIHIVNTFGSHNVYTTGAAFLGALSAPVTAAFLLLGYLRFLRRSGDAGAVEGGSGMVLRYSAAAIAIFIAGGKVLSPQFFIWLIPLVPLIKGQDRRRVLLLFSGVLLLTQIEFPFNYWMLYGMSPYIVVEVALRNAAAIALAAALVLGPVRPAWTMPFCTPRPVTPTIFSPMYPFSERAFFTSSSFSGRMMASIFFIS